MIDPALKKIKQIDTFYASRNLHIGKLVEIGQKRFNISAQAIKRAAWEIYEDIQKGKQIKDVQIAWQVWDKAKRLKISREDLKNFQELKRENVRLKKDRVALIVINLIILTGFILISLL